MSNTSLFNKLILAASVFVIAEVVFSCSSEKEDKEGSSSFEGYSSSSLADEDKPHCGYCSDGAVANCSPFRFHCTKINDSFNVAYCSAAIISGTVFETKKKCEDSNPRPLSSSSSFAN